MQPLAGKTYHSTTRPILSVHIKAVHVSNAGFWIETTDPDNLEGTALEVTGEDWNVLDEVHGFIPE
ncbi:MAG: hypothetical protein PHQ05_06555 [Sterolibacterium sp.]|nr:hypothetical protein [Sterolibacterium sp.]